MSQNKQNFSLKAGWKSSSMISLILANILMIIWAIIEGWNITNIIWIYWFQSVVIGIFQAKKMLDLKEFSTKGLKMNNKPVLPTKIGKLSVVIFFCFHYGFFHFVYLIFLVGILKNVIWTSVFIISIIFFINHLFSYMRNKREDSKKIKNIGNMMFLPYARIIPMHLIILLAIPFSGSLILLIIFMILKTIADVIMHIAEHSKTSVVKFYSQT